jgi:hypothetical protein
MAINIARLKRIGCFLDTRACSGFTRNLREEDLLNDLDQPALKSK